MVYIYQKIKTGALKSILAVDIVYYYIWWFLADIIQDKPLYIVASGGEEFTIIG